MNRRRHKVDKDPAYERNIHYIPPRGDTSYYARKNRRKQRFYASSHGDVERPKLPTTPAARWLVIELPGQIMATAVFVRRAGTTMWRCVGTDHPDIAWFTGIQHVDLINDWLRVRHYRSRWSSTNPAAPRCTADKSRSDDDTPAASMQGSSPSAAQAHNTGPSLNTQPGAPASSENGPPALTRTGVKVLAATMN